MKKLLSAFAAGFVLGVLSGYGAGVREESERIDRLLQLGGLWPQPQTSGGGLANPPKRRTPTRRNAPPEKP